MVLLETIPSKPSEFPISTIAQLIETKGERNESEVFLIEEQTDEQLTFDEVSALANTVAASLREHGVEKGDTVVTMLPNCNDHVLVWFGCMKLGAIWAPINTELGHNDSVYTIESCEPTALLVDDEFLDQYESIRDEITTPRSEFVRGTDREGMHDIETLFDGDGETVDNSITPGDPAILVFTGGTTGKPKPVLHSQFAPLTGAYRYVQAYEPTPEDRQIDPLPPFHIGGQTQILGPMMGDISTLIVKRFSTSRFFDQVNEYEVTLVTLMGSLWRMLVNSHDGPVENTARMGLAGAPPSDYPLIKEYFDVDLFEAYALTECGGSFLTTFHIPDDGHIDVPERGQPVGRSGDWGEISILGTEGEVLPPGEAGEICIRPTIPHSIMEEYYGHPQATIETWEGLWLHTGDIGWMDETEMLYYITRKSHFIRRRGENIAAGEIESELKAHPAVAEVAVVGVPNLDIGGEEVKAYVQTTEDVDPAELVEWCRGRIADFKIPRYIEFVDEFPRSDTKESIQRHVLRDRGIGDAWDREGH